jgi:hypothetical protein
MCYKHFNASQYLLPTFVVEWLTFLVVTSSDLGSEPAILTEFFMDFLSPSRKILGYYCKLGHYRFLPHPVIMNSVDVSILLSGPGEEN